jgi:uncharacterized repeat protein (TIGR01451 family)
VLADPTWNVYPGGNIQTAIDGALNGDTIIIHGDNGNPWTYSGDVNLNNKQLIIQTGGDGSIIISNDFNMDGSTLTLIGTNSFATIRDFNMRNSGLILNDAISLAVGHDLNLDGSTLILNDGTSITTVNDFNMLDSTLTLNDATLYTAGRDLNMLDSNIIDNRMRPADLAVKIDYHRDVTPYSSSADPKTVYGTDKVIYTIAVLNRGPAIAAGAKAYDNLPSGMKFVGSDGQYDSISGLWQVGDLAVGETKQLRITAKTCNSGEIKNTVTVIDNVPNDGNDYAEAKFNARNPVILVHGFNSSPAAWNSLRPQLTNLGIPNFSFDYSNIQPNLHARGDPFYYAYDFSNWLRNYIRGTEGYQGKIDIVCHSMGALVTRFWMAQNDPTNLQRNSRQVGQWIGLAPVISGAAVTDVWNNRFSLSNRPVQAFWSQNTWYYAALVIANIIAPIDSVAGKNMMTTDPETLALNSGGPYLNGIEAGVTYHIIVGTMASQVSLRGVPLVPTVAKIGNSYSLTFQGDGVVANVQSTLPGVPTIQIIGVNHTSIPENSEAIKEVVQLIYHG